MNCKARHACGQAMPGHSFMFPQEMSAASLQSLDGSCMKLAGCCAGKPLGAGKPQARGSLLGLVNHCCV